MGIEGRSLNLYSKLYPLSISPTLLKTFKNQKNGAQGKKKKTHTQEQGYGLLPAAIAKCLVLAMDTVLVDLKSSLGLNYFLLVNEIMNWLWSGFGCDYRIAQGG